MKLSTRPLLRVGYVQQGSASPHVFAWPARAFSICMCLHRLLDFTPRRVVFDGGPYVSVSSVASRTSAPSSDLSSAICQGLGRSGNPVRSSRMSGDYRLGLALATPFLGDASQA